MKSQSQLLAFNRGEVSKLALQRIDVEKLRMAASCQVNWMPLVQGPMMLRPGLLAVGEVLSDDPCRIIPFIFGKTDTALLEFTDSNLRIWIVTSDTEALLSRVAVSTTVNNGTFAATGTWSLAATSGCTAGIAGGQLNLQPRARGGVASAKQQLAISGADQGKEHALRISVQRGPVTFSCGSTDGAQDLITRTVLDSGTHSLAFTPPGASAWIAFEASSTSGPTCQLRTVTNCTIEAAGIVTLPTSYAGATIDDIRVEQSGDIIFLAAKGKQQQKIERRAARSWSIVTYASNNGPFDATPFAEANLYLSDVDGNVNLIADKPIFLAGHVGALFSLFNQGQSNQWQIGGNNAYTDVIRVTGVGVDRTLEIETSGVWAGNLRVQRSMVGPDSGFVTIDTLTTNTSNTYDGSTATTPLDNQIAWYRAGFGNADYTSGLALVNWSYTGGGRTGICRATGYTDPNTLQVEILQPPGTSNVSVRVPTSDWQMSLWGDPSVARWPTAPVFDGGRLWWLGPDILVGSESEAYYDFRSVDADGNPIGDSAVIIERFGSGPVDTVSWGLSMTRLLCGREQSIASVRSSNLDTPMTANAIVTRDCSDQGAERLPAVKLGKRGIYVQQSGRKVYELAYDPYGSDYGDRDLTRLNLDVGAQGFTDIDRSIQPDRMVWLPRGDGQCAALLYDVEDDVVGWWRLQTLGAIENVAVLPRDGLEDAVYFAVKRQVNGVTRRFLEKLALRADCVGGLLNKQLDCAITYSGDPVASLQHAFLPNTLISVWADGAFIGTATTDLSGNFAMPDGHSHTSVVAGLAGAMVASIATDVAVNEHVIGAAYAGQICEVFADIGGTGTVKHVGPLLIGGGLGAIQLPDNKGATQVFAFVGYVAPFFSARLVHSVPGVSPINGRKELAALGVILYDTAAQGLQFGQTPAQLDNLPQVEAGMTIDPATVWDELEEPVTALPGQWDTDSRLMLVAQAPNPCTVGAVALQIA